LPRFLAPPRSGGHEYVTVKQRLTKAIIDQAPEPVAEVTAGIAWICEFLLYLLSSWRSRNST